MNLTNQHILHLFRWLNVPLHGEELRARNKFIATLNGQHEAIHAKRQAMLEEISDKDEDGKAIVTDGDYQIPKEKKEEYVKLYTDFLNETNEYETAGIKGSIKSILMTKMTRGLDIEEGKVFEEIIGELE